MVLALAAGCAAQSVDVKGNDVDIVRLGGVWKGTYAGRESGRQGTISFELFVGYRVAEGFVMMNAGSPEAKSLGIKFVTIEGRQLKGTIAPYMDPSCKCMVDTSFVGSMKGGVIDGTFVTTPQGSNVTQGGTWSVQRQP
jgi:hypothetical protein